jgi:hypothetical protein
MALQPNGEIVVVGSVSASLRPRVLTAGPMRAGA